MREWGKVVSCQHLQPPSRAWNRLRVRFINPAASWGRHDGGQPCSGLAAPQCLVDVLAGGSFHASNLGTTSLPGVEVAIFWGLSMCHGLGWPAMGREDKFLSLLRA